MSLASKDKRGLKLGGSFLSLDWRKIKIRNNVISVHFHLVLQTHIDYLLSVWFGAMKDTKWNELLSVCWSEIIGSQLTSVLELQKLLVDTTGISSLVEINFP